MSSTIGAYNRGYTGLAVNQLALSTISQNLANINTTGYSRQRVNTSEIVTTSSTVGSGVSADSITRLRNELLDSSYREGNADLSYYQTKSGLLDSLETLLGDLDSTSDDSAEETGVQAALSDFFDSWTELSKDLSSTSAQESVLESAVSLVDLVTELDDQLQALQENCADNVYSAASDLNDLASQLADINAQIATAESSGATANELEDARDSLVDQMSELADVTVSVQSDGIYTVSIGDVYLVSGSKTHTLVASGSGTADAPLTVSWQGLNKDAEFSSGSILALLEEADQSAVTTVDGSSSYNFDPTSASSIAEVRQALNALITTVATQVNSLFTSGCSLGSTTTNSTLFFVSSASGDASGLSIDNITVNSTLLADASLVAVSATGAASDGGIASSIAELLDTELLQVDATSQTIGDFYTSIVSWTATEGETYAGLATTQDSLVAQINTQRESVSSVSMDEELTKLIEYQSAYSAATKYISTVDTLVQDILALIR